MQLRDGSHEAQSEAASRRGAGFFDAVKAPQHSFALPLRNAGAGITDFETNPVACVENPERHPAVRRRVLDCIVDEIAESLEEQARITCGFGGALGRGFQQQRNALGLRYRVVEFGNIGRHGIEIEGSKTGAPRPALHLGYAQQSGKGRKNGLSLDNCVIDCSVVLRWRCAAAYSLQAGQKACQRGAQVMCDVIGYALHLMHQPLDLVEHPIHNLDQTIDVAAAAVAGQPFTQGSIDDPFDGAGYPLNPAEGSRSGDHAAGKSDDQGDQRARQHRCRQKALELVYMAHLLGYKKELSRWLPMQHATVRHRVTVARQYEIEWRIEGRLRLRQSCPASGNPASAAFEQGEWTAAFGAERDALVQQAFQLGATSPGTHRYFACQSVVEIARQKAGGLDIEKPKNDNRPGTDQPEKQQRKPEARRTPEVIQSHGEHIRSPAPYGLVAGVHLPRAYAAVCRYGHRLRWSEDRSGNPTPLRTPSSASPDGRRAASDIRGGGTRAAIARRRTRYVSPDASTDRSPDRRLAISFPAPKPCGAAPELRAGRLAQRTRTAWSGNRHRPRAIRGRAHPPPTTRSG